MQASNSAEDRFSDAAEADRLPAQQRSTQSVRAEESYRAWTDMPFAERPLAATRGAHASALFEVMRAHKWSAERLADRLGVNERQALKYLKGEAPIPTTIFDALPKAMADDFAARIRAGEQGTAQGRFRAAFDALEREGCGEIIVELLPRIGALSARKRSGR